MRKTPLGRVLGLGSAKSGTEHWWAERVTAIAAINSTWPMTISIVGICASNTAARIVAVGGMASAPSEPVVALVARTPETKSAYARQVAISAR